MGEGRGRGERLCRTHVATTHTHTLKRRKTGAAKQGSMRRDRQPHRGVSGVGGFGRAVVRRRTARRRGSGSRRRHCRVYRRACASGEAGTGEGGIGGEAGREEGKDGREVPMGKRCLAEGGRWGWGEGSRQGRLSEEDETQRREAPRQPVCVGGEGQGKTRREARERERRSARFCVLVLLVYPSAPRAETQSLREQTKKRAHHGNVARHTPGTMLKPAKWEQAVT